MAHTVKHCYLDASRNYSVECSDISEARREMNRHTVADCASGLSLLYAGENPIDCRKWSSPGISATVIFDNGGGLTVQLAAAGLVWSHFYDGSSDSIWNAASDVKKALWECEFAYYDGHEPEADVLRPTPEEIRNGGYRVERFENFGEFEDFCLSDHDDSWGNIVLFCDFVESGAL